ncbi:hypothetical protein [Stappia sp. MMSF_3263]|uniref:hypothetical protein n=1 Tax=Stappia sp. MMSF_3263 TaxID=3046693 RepID=UPI00273D7F2B|nr:hypothetical protein [Stappia sp. MMSF_3263]
MSDTATDTEAGPRILLGHAGHRGAEARAQTLVAAMPGAFVLPAGSDGAAPLPDAILWIGAPGPDEDRLSPVIASLRDRARAAGIALPLVIAGDRLPAGAHPRGVEAIVPQACPPAILQERIAEAVRQSLRMEEARLRRAVFGRDPFAPDAMPRLPEDDAERHNRIPVLVAGNGSRVAAALAGGLSAIELVGCLTPDAALARLGEHPFRMLVADLPEARALELVAALRRDPRHIALPVMALANGQPATAALLEAGASDVVAPTASDDDLGARCRLLLRIGARRHLAGTCLSRYRGSGPRARAALPREAFERYLTALRRCLALRGDEPHLLRLEEIDTARPPIVAANDDPFAAAIGNPVRSAALAASRDEDFVARVAEIGDVALVRNRQALERIERRIAAIVASTSFA